MIDDADIFKQAVKDVKPLKIKSLKAEVQSKKPKPKPIAHKLIEDEQKVLRDSLSDEFFDSIESGEALNYLKKGGGIVLEIGEAQAKPVSDMLCDEDKYESIKVTQDYSGYDRVVSARKKNNG